MIMTKRKIQLLLLSSILFLISCSKDVVYRANHEFDTEGWHKDSVICYQFPITDTTQAYDILFYVRHSGHYLYQNLWLFTGETDSILNDTIEFFLADDRGVWIGDRGNGHTTIPLQYEQNHRFDHSGEQTLYVKHGMRSDYLRGLTDMGIEVRRSKQ